MAEPGRRDVVRDPFAQQGVQQLPERDLSTMPVRNPMQSGGNGWQQEQNKLEQAISGINGAIANVLDVKKDQWQTEGRIAFMQGQTEQQIAQTGNRYTMQGWQALNASTTASQFYQNELQRLQNGGNEIAPEQYARELTQRRAEALRSLPNDPAIRKVWAAAFDDVGPRLAAQHTAAHNTFNQQRTQTGLRDNLLNTSRTNSDATRVMPGNVPLPLSPSIVRRTVQFAPTDVDVLTKTILGEAGAEGPDGMAAVAHVIVNRTIDGRWGRSIAATAQQPQQFSTWNAPGMGGNNPEQWAGTEAYSRARQIALAVLSGRHVDPTNGATHFYAPRGMQNGQAPVWATETESESGGPIVIGGHRFSGRMRNTPGKLDGASEGPNSPSVSQPVLLPSQAQAASEAGLLPSAEQRGLAAYTGARPAPSSTGGRITFSRPEEATISDDLRGRVTGAAQALGRDLEIISGNRGPGGSGRNAVVGGARGSQHIDGNAVDINLRGLSDEQKAELVQELRRQGVTRFGMYSGGNALHVDMSSAQGGEWFMFNKSNANMRDAPQWYKDLSAQPPPPRAQGPSGTDPNQAGASPMANPQDGPQTQVQQLIRGSGAPRAVRAQALTDAMLIQFQSGSDQLFRDAGGMGMLYELGATTQQIQAVQRAQEAHRTGKLNEFNVESIRWNNQQLADISSGRASLDEVLSRIEQRKAASGMTDTQAQALAANVVAADKERGNRFNLSPEVQREATNIFARHSDRTFTAEKADEELRALAARSGIPEQQLNGFIAQMWNTERQQQQNLASEARKRAEEKARSDQAEARAMAALSQGSGLAAVSGTVIRYDQNGNKIEQDARQFASDQMYDRLSSAAASSIANERDPAMRQQLEMSGAAMRDQSFYSAMRRQNVVNEKLQAQLTASSSGSIIDQTTGKVRPDAMQAFDIWMRMSRDPGVGSAYMQQYFRDADGLALFRTAEGLVSGVDIETALRKAADQMQYNRTEEGRATIQNSYQPGVVEQQQITTRVSEAISTLANDGIIFSGSVSARDRADAIARAGDLTPRIMEEASRLRTLHPHHTREVNMKIAMDRVLANTTLVGGNLIASSSEAAANSTNPALPMSIRNRMGLGKYEPDTVNRAISDHLVDSLNKAAEHWMKTGQDPMNGAGRWWFNNAERRPWSINPLELGKKAAEAFGPPTGFAAGAQQSDNATGVTPRFRMSYNERTGQAYIVLKTGPNEEWAEGPPITIDVARVGQAYRDRVLDRPSMLSNVFRSIRESVTRSNVLPYLAPTTSGGPQDTPVARQPTAPAAPVQNPLQPR
ncbi:endolysin [Nostoc phage NMeng1]|nr:endolysin [Nostoc phage NMeng1]